MRELFGTITVIFALYIVIVALLLWVVAWDEFGDGASSVGEQALVELVRHPERIIDMLVTLRAVQTLSLIDIVNYRDHVYRLGRYQDDNDPPPPAFAFGS